MDNFSVHFRQANRFIRVYLDKKLGSSPWELIEHMISSKYVFTDMFPDKLPTECPKEISSQYDKYILATNKEAYRGGEMMYMFVISYMKHFYGTLMAKALPMLEKGQYAAAAQELNVPYWGICPPGKFVNNPEIENTSIPFDGGHIVFRVGLKKTLIDISFVLDSQIAKGLLDSVGFTTKWSGIYIEEKEKAILRNEYLNCTEERLDDYLVFDVDDLKIVVIVDLSINASLGYEIFRLSDLDRKKTLKNRILYLKGKSDSNDISVTIPDDILRIAKAPLEDISEDPSDIGNDGISAKDLEGIKEKGGKKDPPKITPRKVEQEIELVPLSNKYGKFQNTYKVIELTSEMYITDPLNLVQTLPFTRIRTVEEANKASFSPLDIGFFPASPLLPTLVLKSCFELFLESIKYNITEEMTLDYLVGYPFMMAISSHSKQLLEFTTKNFELSLLDFHQAMAKRNEQGPLADIIDKTQVLPRKKKIGASTSGEQNDEEQGYEEDNIYAELESQLESIVGGTDDSKSGYIRSPLFTNYSEIFNLLINQQSSSMTNNSVMIRLCGKIVCTIQRIIQKLDSTMTSQHYRSTDMYKNDKTYVLVLRISQSILSTFQLILTSARKFSPEEITSIKKVEEENLELMITRINQQQYNVFSLGLFAEKYSPLVSSLSVLVSNPNNLISSVMKQHLAIIQAFIKSKHGKYQPLTVVSPKANVSSFKDVDPLMPLCTLNLMEMAFSKEETFNDDSLDLYMLLEGIKSPTEFIDSPEKLDKLIAWMCGIIKGENETTNTLPGTEHKMSDYKVIFHKAFFYLLYTFYRDASSATEGSGFDTVRKNVASILGVTTVNVKAKSLVSFAERIGFVESDLVIYRVSLYQRLKDSQIAWIKQIAMRVGEQEGAPIQAVDNMFEDPRMLLYANNKMPDQVKAYHDMKNMLSGLVLKQKIDLGGESICKNFPNLVFIAVTREQAMGRMKGYQMPKSASSCMTEFDKEQLDALLKKSSSGNFLIDEVADFLTREVTEVQKRTIMEYHKNRRTIPEDVLKENRGKTNPERQKVLLADLKELQKARALKKEREQLEKELKEKLNEQYAGAGAEGST